MMVCVCEREGDREGVNQRRSVCVCACVRVFSVRTPFRSCIDSRALNDGVCVCEREGETRSERKREGVRV